MDLSPAAEIVSAFFTAMAARAVQVFLSPAAVSVTAVIVAGCIAAAFLSTRRKDPRRPLPLKVLWRALLPRKITRSRSGRADILFALINLFIVGSMIGWAVLSSVFVGHYMADALNAAFGARTMHVPDSVAVAVMTLALFLAFEFGYWIDHYLSHNVPFLWEFHKVHHTAEVLTPLTDFRVHPVDTLLFNNILGLTMGVTGGAITFLLGREVQPYMLAGSNVLSLVFAYGLMHLQHSQIWIAFTGVWGRLLLSPAHHQIHHSTDPRHFNRNLGSFIAIFDVLFGTLCVPAKQRQKLTFGVAPVCARQHTLREAYLTPFARAFATLGLAQAVKDILDEGANDAPAGEERPLAPLKAAE